MELFDDVKIVIKNKNVEDVLISINYENWRGEISMRDIIPLDVYVKVLAENSTLWCGISTLSTSNLLEIANCCAANSILEEFACIQKTSTIQTPHLEN